MIKLKPIIRTQSASHMSLGNLKRAQNNRCFYCGMRFGDKIYNQANRVHLFPNGIGYDETLLDAVYACSGCKIHKSNKMPNAREVVRFHKLYLGSAYFLKDKTIIATRNNKPQFKLAITSEIIRNYCK